MNSENRGNPLWVVWSMVQRTITVFLSKKTPWYVKLALAAGLIYVVSPYDLIPEWVPVFGVMDDLALVALLITWASGYHEK
jgi:uncharacterized membrane protein YkvA (DUF1232 family)